LKSYTRKTSHNELWFTEKGAEAHEWYFVPAGRLRPARCDYHLIGTFSDECEADAFIDFCEQSWRSYNDRVSIVHVRYSHANFRKYHAPR